MSTNEVTWKMKEVQGLAPAIRSPTSVLCHHDVQSLPPSRQETGEVLTGIYDCPRKSDLKTQLQFL